MLEGRGGGVDDVVPNRREGQRRKLKFPSRVCDPNLKGTVFLSQEKANRTKGRQRTRQREPSRCFTSRIAQRFVALCVDHTCCTDWTTGMRQLTQMGASEVLMGCRCRRGTSCRCPSPVPPDQWRWSEDAVEALVWVRQVWSGVGGRGRGTGLVLQGLVRCRRARSGVVVLVVSEDAVEALVWSRPDQWWRSRCWSGPPDQWWRSRLLVWSVRPVVEVEVLVWSARPVVGGRGTGSGPPDQGWRSRYWSGPPGPVVEVEGTGLVRQTSGGGRGTGSGPPDQW